MLAKHIADEQHFSHIKMKVVERTKIISVFLVYAVKTDEESGITACCSLQNQERSAKDTQYTQHKNKKMFQE